MCIYDFVEAEQAGTNVRTFKTGKQLSKYIRENDKRYPLRLAKQNKILRWMLIELV